VVTANNDVSFQCPGQVLNDSPCPKEVVHMSPVVEWLQNLGLAKYEEIFVREEIDWDTLKSLTEEVCLLFFIANNFVHIKLTIFLVTPVFWIFSLGISDNNIEGSIRFMFFLAVTCGILCFRKCACSCESDYVQLDAPIMKGFAFLEFKWLLFMVIFKDYVVSIKP